MSRPTLTRRSLFGALALAVVAPPLVQLVRDRGFDRERRSTYVALIDALAAQGALPGEARGADARLAAIYTDALPRRRKEIDDVLDELTCAGLAERPPAERLSVLRGWAEAGGERRALA